MILRIITAIITISVSVMTTQARIMFDKPSVLFSGNVISHDNYIKDGCDIGLSFWQKEWFGIGVGLGYRKSSGFVRMKGPEKLDILQDTIEYYNLFLRISALISPKILKIKKFTLYGELWPYVGTSGSRFNLAYGYLDEQGTPKIGKYSGSPFFIGGRAGLGLKIGKYFYISYGFDVSTGNGGKLEVKYEGKGNPDFKQRMMHGTYLSIGYRL